MIKQLFLVAGLAVSGAAHAAVFADRAAFNAVLGTHTYIDFENLVGTPQYPGNYGGGTGHSSQIGGITIGALNFAGRDDPHGNGAFIIGMGTPAYSMGSYNALSGFKRLMITLAGGVTAFGFDVGQPTGQANGPLHFTIAVRPVGGTLATVAIRTDGVQGMNFFGYTGAAFDQVEVSGNFNYYVFFDNVAFGSVAPVAPGVPEPASWAMLIAGFGLTGAAMRRRQGAVVSA